MSAFVMLQNALAGARRLEHKLAEDMIELKARTEAAAARRSELEDLLDAFKAEREE